MAALQSALAPLDISTNPAVLAERIVQHLFNYVSGFVGGMITPETLIPVNVVARWYEVFLGKVRAGGVGFLERAE
jgi:protein Hikeshi